MSQTKQRLLSVTLLAIILIFNVIGTHNALSGSQLGFNDFLSRWEGARSYLIDGLSPYSDEAGLNIQYRIYHGPVPEGRDPSLFAYPFYMVFLVAPLVYLEYSWAAVIWMVLLETLLVGILVLMLDLLKWRPRPLVFGLLIAGTLLCYPSLRGLLLGQPSHLVIFAQMLTVWALVKNKDNLAGVALVLTTIKPQMGFLFMPFILLWALRYRRWRFIRSFTLVLTIAVVASFILWPSWLGEWIQGVLQYTEYTPNDSANHILLVEYLGLSILVEVLIGGLQFLYVCWAAYKVLVHEQHERFLWTTALIFVVINLVSPKLGSSHFAIFIIVLLAFYGRQLARRRRGSLWVSLLTLAIIVLPWIQFALTRDGNNEHRMMGVIMPVTAFIVLVVTRKLWWRQTPVINPETENTVIVAEAMSN
jgi:hypothetical protein